MADNTLVNDLAKYGKAKLQKDLADIATPSVQMSVAMDQGNTLATDNQIIQDKTNLTPFEFGQKYGPLIQSKLGEQSINAQALRDYMLTPDRTAGQIVGDLGTNIFTGMVQGVGSVGVLGAGMVDNQLGVDANQKLNDFIDWNRQEVSPQLKRGEFLNSVQSNLDAQDNAKQYEQDKKTNSPLVAGLKYVGRGVMEGATRIAQNPAAAENVVTQGVGSLLAAGPMSKGLQAAGLGAETALTTSIGALEGGGAYTGTVSDIMARSPEELMQVSPEYRKMVESGMDPEAAKAQLAGPAGLTAAAIQAPLGALTSKALGVLDFEANPLARQTVKQTVATLAKEPTEEAIQGFTGQVAQNVGTQLFADPNQSLLEGTGNQIVEGALGGLGSAGLVQAPAAIGTVVKTAAKTVAAPVVAAANAINGRYDNIQADAQKQSNVNEASLAPEVKQQAANTEQLANNVLDAIKTSGPMKPEDVMKVMQLKDSLSITAEDYSNMPAPMKEKARAAIEAGDTHTKFDALVNASAVIEDDNSSEADKNAAGAYVLQAIMKDGQLIDQIYPELVNRLPKDRPEIQALRDHVGILGRMMESPKIVSALKWASEQMKISEESVQNIDVNTPEGEAKVNQVADIAAIAPQAISAGVADMALKQIDGSGKQISLARRRALESAATIDRAAQLYIEQGKTIPVNQEDVRGAKMDFVNRQVLDDGADTRAPKLSLKDHIVGINQADAANDQPELKRRVASLARFTQSQINKVKALNQAISNNNGEPVPFRAVNKNGDFYDNKKGIMFKSERLARTIHAEAVALTAATNEIIARYGLNIPPREVPALNLPEIQSEVKKAPSNEPVTTQSQATKTETNNDQPTLGASSPEPTQSEGNGKPVSPETTVAGEPKAVAGEASTVESTPVSDAAPEQKPAEPVKAETNSVAPVEQVQQEVPQEAQPTEEPKKEVKKTIKDVFSNLVRSAGKNYFHLAFKLQTEAKSRIAEVESPLQVVKAALKSGSAFMEFLKADQFSYRFGAEQAKVIGDLVDIGDAVIEKMTERLTTALQKNRIGERIQKGEEDLLGVADLLGLNVVNAETQQYDQKLIESAVLAGLDWIANAQSPSEEISMEQAAEILGVTEDQVTPKMLEVLQNNMTVEMAVRGLSKSIVKFWGLKQNSKVPMNYSEGIPEAVAKEVLYGLEGTGLIKLGYDGKADGARDINIVVFAHENAKAQNTVRLVKGSGVSRLIRDMVLINDPEVEVAFDKALTDEGQIDDTQLNNPVAKLTPMQIEALTKAQSVGHVADTTMHDLLQDIGEEAYVSWRAGTEYKAGDLELDHTDKKLNANHWASIKGKFRTYVNNYRNTLNQVAEMANHAQATGKKLSEVKVFYKHHFNVLGRLQMVGKANPQNNKTAREVFSAMKSVLDISKEGKDWNNFLLAVAQGVGKKTEKFAKSKIVEDMKNDLFGKNAKYGPAISVIESWLEQRENGVREMPADLIPWLSALELTDHGLHSLVAVAQYNRAKKTGADLTKFETFAYLEADGKTNGVINALMLYARGAFNQPWIQTVAKGGAFIGRLGRSLNMHTDPSPDNLTFLKDTQDAYEAVSEGSKVAIADRFAKVSKGTAEAVETAAAVRRLFTALDMNIKPTANGLEITRAFTKNPVTITVYGSGKNGIAKKATKVIVDAIYAKISQAQSEGKSLGEMIYPQDPERFYRDFQMLTENVLFFNKDVRSWDATPVQGKTKSDRQITIERERNRDPLTFTVDDTSFANLTENMKTLIVTPMSQAIESVITQHTGRITETLQTATQLQTIVMMKLLEKRVSERLEMKKADPEKWNYRKGDTLSRDEYNDILKSLLSLAPMISTGTQNYYLGGGQTSELDSTIEGLTIPSSVSRALDGTMKTKMLYWGPTNPGVKITPTLTIGFGDGWMQMSNLVNSLNGMDERTVRVFDGINMPVDMIEDYSTQINEAVYNSWLEHKDPLKAMADSFAVFMEKFPFDELSQIDQSKLIAFGNSVAETFPKEIASQGLEALNEMQALAQRIQISLQDDVVSGEARRRTLREFGFSVDQMASGNAPYVREGKIQVAEDASYADLEKAMNDRYRFHLDQVMNEAKLTSLAKMFDEAGAIASTPMEGGKAVRVLGSTNGHALFKVIKDLLSDVQKDTMFGAIKAIGKSGYTMVIGPREALLEWERQNHPERQVDDKLDYKGKVDPIGRYILIDENAGVDTVVHELIHAATFDKLYAHYNNPKSSGLDPKDTAAIERIEGLMMEWLDLDQIDELGDGWYGRSSAEATIQAHLVEGNKAAAVNEFMAWVLGDVDLSRRAGQVKVKNKLFMIIDSVIAAIKQLIWGDPNKEIPREDTILGQLRLNTRILMSTPSAVARLKQDAANIVLHHSNAFGNDDRIRELMSRINDRIISWIDDAVDPAQRVIRQSKNRLDASDSLDLAQIFEAHFDGLQTMQGKTTFAMIQNIMMSDVELNSNSMNRMQELYEHVMENLKNYDFRTNTDPNDQNDIAQADAKFNALNGLLGGVVDRNGRSSLLSSFVALAAVDDQFRKILENIPRPKKFEITEKSLDGYAEGIVMSAMDRMSDAFAGQRYADGNTKEILDNLTFAMIDNVGDQRTFIEGEAENFIDAVESKMVDAIHQATDVLADKTQAVNAQSDSKIVKAAATVVYSAATLLNQERSERVVQGLTNWFNTKAGFQETRALFNDLLGRTKQNSSVVDMLSAVRAMVQQTRQKFREEVPNVLASAFNERPTSEQWTTMFKALAKTDIATLAKFLSPATAIALLRDDRALRRETAAVERTIQAMDRSNAQFIMNKARQLAEYMNTGNHGHELLRNAHAISRMLSDSNRKRSVQSQALVDAIDKLVSLYAIDGLSQEVKTEMSEILTNDQAGVEFVTSYLMELQKEEFGKVQGNEVALLNHYKGHIPSEARYGGSLVLAHSRDVADLIMKGYKKIGDYTGSVADASASQLGYYYLPVSGKAQFNQGVMQTAHLTVSGVDPQTGYTMGTLHGGRITAPNEVRRTQAILRNYTQASDETLIPVFDEDGNVYAYERTASADMISLMKKSTQLSEMMGAWRGRQVEEHYAREMNEQLVDRLHQEWLGAQSAAERAQFVNVLDLRGKDKDPLLVEAVKLLPRDTMEYVQALYGPNEFWVRRESLLDTFGVRQASVGDMFTKETRWSDAVTENFTKAAITVFGTKAYPWMLQGEQAVQQAISNVKQLIVVKSVIVPVGNLVSNMIQLANRGVPIRHILTGVGKKTAEINYYIKARDRMIRVEAQLHAAEGRNDFPNIRKYQNELRSIEDSFKKMSIWPLIQGGQFTSISAGQVTEEDLALSDGRFNEWLEQKIGSLPAALREPLRYGLVTRDTALYRGLARATQYGDFVAKAILYDDLVKRQGTDSQEAIATVSEAYVNYNRPAGRSRQYLESVGLMWFYNYKLRIMKEAMWTLRNRPLRSLLLMTTPVGIPLKDNIVAKAISGGLGFTVGPRMAFGAYSFNPWVNLLGL